MNPDTGPDRSLRIGEVARRYGVGTDTIRTWVRQGRLHATKSASGQRLFSEREVEADLAARGFGPGRPATIVPATRPLPPPTTRRPAAPTDVRHGLPAPFDHPPEVIMAREELELTRLVDETERIRRGAGDETATREAQRVAAEEQRRA